MVLAFSLMDIITVPFGYIMEWLYRLTSNYGVSLILFSLIVKLILLYPSLRGKKGMMKMARLNPQLKKLEAKYGDDKEAASAPPAAACGACCPCCCCSPCTRWSGSP